MTAFDLFGMSVVPELVAKVLTLRCGFEALSQQAYARPHDQVLQVQSLQAWRRWQDALALAKSAFDDLYYAGAQQLELPG